MDNLAIILDGGHGWNTPGKRSSRQIKGRAVLRENEFNDAVVNMLFYSLVQKGIPVFIVSSESFNTSLNERCARERKIAKEQRERGRETIFISIHADWFNNHTATGSTVFYKTKSGKGLADIFYNRMKDLLIPARKPKKANYKVLRDTASPAILIENGFMSNDDDLNLLASPLYRVAIVDQLGKAIIDYKKQIQ